MCGRDERDEAKQSVSASRASCADVRTLHDLLWQQDKHKNGMH